MKLLVSHLSALRYWRSANALEVASARPSRVRSLSDGVSGVRDVRRMAPKDHGFVMGEDCPLDVLVGSPVRRRASKEIAPHVWRGGVVEGSFACIAENVYVSTPEFTFLQLAGTLDVVELARLGNELCGTYNLRRGARFTERDTPLTTRSRLARYVARSKGSHGAGKALRALRWVCDRCASPQETNMVLALCLPKRMGGYGLPLPEVNPRVDVGKRLGTYVDGEYYYPDAMWVREVRGRRVRVTVEYDSHEWHDEAADAERTRIRRNAFKTMGILVTSINRSQMRDGAKFLSAARQVARDLGIWREEPSLSMISACDRLLYRLANESVW